MSDTNNRWVWYGVLAFTLALHLLFLYRTPLSSSELRQTLASLDGIRHVDFPPKADSPLLLLGNMMLFSVFGAGNGIARLIPALAGVSLVLLPLYWRRYLGHTGALAAAGVLLSSPLILFASRRVEGTILSTLAAAFLFTTLTPLWNKDAGDNQRRIMIMLGVSIGFLSGPAFYDLLFTGIAAWLFKHLLRRKPVEEDWYRFWWRPALMGLGIALLISIGFGFRWSGWNGIMEGLSHWLSSWTAMSDVSHLGALLLYEPFTLILAVLGIGYAWKLWDSFSLRVILWALLNLLITSLRGGAPVAGAGTTILAFAYLSGYGIENVINRMSGNHSKWMILHIGMGFVFLLPALLGLTQYASGLISAEQPLLLLSGAIVILALQALLAFLFSLVLPMQVLWRSALLGVSVMCLFMQMSFSLQLNFVRPTSALEPAVMDAGSPDMVAFKQMVSDIAIQRGLREDTLIITIVDGDAEVTNSVRWMLRDFKRIKLSSTWPSETELANTDMLVITPESMDLSTVESPGWKGMRFTVIHSYLAPVPGCRRNVTPESTTLDCTDWVNWYLYRTTPYPRNSKGLILWVNR